MKIIYRLYCKTTQKSYIGETSNFEKRIQQHFKNQTDKRKAYPLYQDIAKYGKHDFEISILEQCSEEIAHEIEAKWIKHFDSFNNGYNLAVETYKGSIGKPLSRAQKEHYSNLFSGENNPMYGKDWRENKTAEELLSIKQKQSKASKGKPKSEKHKQKLKENSAKAKKVGVYVQNELTKTFNSVQDLANSLNVKYSTTYFWVTKQKEKNGTVYKYI